MLWYIINRESKARAYGIFKMIWPHNPFFIKHFTALFFMKHFTARGSGSGEDLPRRVWVGSKPNQNEWGPLLSSGLESPEEDFQGTCEEDSQHLYIPASPGSRDGWDGCVGEVRGGGGGDKVSLSLRGVSTAPKQGRKSPLYKLLAASGTFYVE